MNVKFLDSLTDAERDAVLKSGAACSFDNGQTIFSNGEAGDSMFLIRAGRVRIVLYSEDGKEILLNIVGPGDVFGEFSFLDGTARSADAIADGECDVLKLGRGDLTPVFAQYPEIAFKFSSHLAALLRQSTARIETLVFLPLNARLARLLVDHSTRYGSQIAEGVLVADGLTQGEYAQMVSASRESVNKQLRQWQNDSLIECRKDGIVLCDLAGLRQIAGISE